MNASILKDKTLPVQIPHPPRQGSTTPTPDIDDSHLGGGEGRLKLRTDRRISEAIDLTFTARKRSVGL